MKRWVALFMVFAWAYPVSAHFIWIVPETGAKAKVVFSDSLEPDGNVPISKIGQTILFGRTDEKEVAAHSRQEKDHLHVHFHAKLPLEIGGTCAYGVSSKKEPAFLLNYYAKATLGTPTKDSAIGKGWAKLPLEIVSAKPGGYHVLWQGKTVTDVTMTALVPGESESRELKRADDGTFHLGPIPAVGGQVGLRARYVEKKAGELDGKKYAEIRHYSTWTFEVGAKKGVVPAGQPALNIKPDPAATKLLADARAARAVWQNFPGFTADLEVNHNGTVSKGRVEVEAQGKVQLKLEADDEVKSWARREIASLVGHRLPGSGTETPCAFLDKNEQHPSGRAIRVLNDELHSSYRIRDRQILEVNRSMKDTRFTITVLENYTNKEKQFLPVSHVVNSWDLKANVLVSSMAHHYTWTRLGAFDLPTTVRVVHAKAGQLDNRQLTFSQLQLRP